MLVHVVIPQEISLHIYSSETYSTLGEGLISQLYPIKKIKRKNSITGICFHSATCCVLSVFCFFKCASFLPLTIILKCKVTKIECISKADLN
jgi:hypothetical protein